MHKVEVLDDQADRRALVENRRRDIAIAAALRLAAGVGFLVLGILWTSSKQMSMGVVGLSLFVYVALASAFFTCGQNAIVQRMAWAMPFADTIFAFVIARSALSIDAAFAPSWAVVSLAVYTVIVVLAGLSLPLWLVGVVTALAIVGESVFLHMAMHSFWPMLVSALALAFVATATSTIQRKTKQALHRAHEAQVALASLAEVRGENQDLERLQREKDALLEVLIHDLRGPVGAAMLTLEYLVLELRKHPSQAALLEAADDGLTTLNGLGSTLSQILDAAKLETGRLTLRMDVVPLRPIIERAIHETTARARSRGITLAFEAHEEIRAAVDTRLLPRALEALLGYGLRHTPQGGRMLLAATSTTSEIRLSLHMTAPAIPAAERERIFDKLPAADPEARRKSAWGLGLHFCKLVFSSHQGSITLEDVDGWPTAFVIRLPAIPKSV